MLLVTETDDRGSERILVLPYGSFNSFFTSDEGGSGMTLHMIPGLLIPTKEFERHHDAVREAILGEAAQRMQVSPEEVLRQNLALLEDGDGQGVRGPFRVGSATTRQKPPVGVFSVGLGRGASSSKRHFRPRLGGSGRGVESPTDKSSGVRGQTAPGGIQVCRRRDNTDENLGSRGREAAQRIRVVSVREQAMPLGPKMGSKARAFACGSSALLAPLDAGGG